MDPARIAALLEPFLGRRNLNPATEVDPEQSLRDSGNVGAALTEFQLEQISIYIDLLLRWNARINLTAIREPEEIVTRHFGESLFLARHVFPLKRDTPVDARPQSRVQSLIRLIDLGSGAGFPALPTKIWAPHIHLTLIESNHKKATFLREVIRALTLTNVNVIAARAEALIALPDANSYSPADVVTLRAVEKFDSIVPLAVRFLAPSGRLALLVSSPQLEKVENHLPDFEWSVEHIPESHSRVLFMGQRRAGNSRDSLSGKRP
jgi:16S rRNA (guanine527-N7)-methyltransferase